VRRIRLLLGEPTRDGDTEIVVLTNLSGEDASAEKVVSSWPPSVPFKSYPTPWRRTGTPTEYVDEHDA